MCRRARQIARAIAVSCVLICCAPSSSLQRGYGTGENPTAGGLPEVRMRKLHLVRPDLSPYPIAYEVYC